MSNLSINIQQIDNGYLVAFPPVIQKVSAISRDPRQQQEQLPPQPVVRFGANYEEVCNLLKEAFPPVAVS